LLKFLAVRADGTAMTVPPMPDLPSSPPPSGEKSGKKSGKPSVEHIVLGAVLLVVLAVGGWFLLKAGSSAKTTSTATEPATSRPTAAAGAYASPKSVLTLKPTTITLVPMTKAAYLKAGNKICAKMNAAGKALGDFPSEPKAQAAFALKTVTITEHARKLLMALPAPADSAAKLASFYVDVAKADATTKALAKALTAGNTVQAKALEQKLGSQGDKANAEFTAYGLTVCGED
jgi:hypothetical protein